VSIFNKTTEFCTLRFHMDRNLAVLSVMEDLELEGSDDGSEQANIQGELFASLSAMSPDALLNALRKARKKYQEESGLETGMEDIWVTLTEGACGCHHGFELENEKQMDDYLRILRAAMVVAHEENWEWIKKGRP